MKQQKINKRAIQEYVLPELETLKSLLTNLHLNKSLQALLFLERLVEIEIKESVKTH